MSPVNFLLALNFLIINVIYGLEDLNCVMVTEHILYFDLKGHFWVMRSVYKTSCCFCLATVVLIPFAVFGSGLVRLMSVRPVTV